MDASKANDAAPEQPQARQEYDRITEHWSWDGFNNRTTLDVKVSKRLRDYNAAQTVIAYTLDVDGEELVSKPAALLHRLCNGGHPPTEDAMASAKAVLNAGDVPLDDILEGISNGTTEG